MSKLLVLALGGAAVYLLTSKKGNAPATPMGAAVPGSNTVATPLVPNASFFQQAASCFVAGPPCTGPLDLIAATVPPGALDAAQGAVSAAPNFIGPDLSSTFIGQD
jgi:hypothetical protein